MNLRDDLDGQQFACILADPPWHFQSWSTKGTGRSAEQHYSVMRLSDIKALDVPAISARDCALFLWAVDCMLPEALDVMAAWGFTFKTVAFTWLKQTPLSNWHIGHGYWTRAGSEQCLLGTRGKPPRGVYPIGHPKAGAVNHAIRQVVIARRRQHSRKPDEVRTRIEQLVTGPRLELFARECAPGWTAWGFEAEKFVVSDAGKDADARAA